MTVLIILLCFTALTWAQPTDLRVVDVTPTEAAIRYVAPSSAACTVEASTQSNYSPVVNDVNASYFANSNSDLGRSDTVVEGRRRTVVIGKTGRFYRDSTAVSRSRALQANTQHYIRVTCGSAATISLFTANIPLGQTATTQSIPMEGPFSYAKASLNPLFQSSFVDPSTGLLIRQYPNVFGAAFAGSTGATGVTFGCAENINSGWSASDAGTLASALSADDNVYAQTNTAGAKLFAGLCDSNYNKYPSNSTFDTNELSFQNLKLRIDCTGSGCGSGKTVKVALTTDRGTVIQTKTITATTTEQQIIICHTAPCSVQAHPGDVWSPDLIPRDRYSIGLGYIYNDSGDYTRLNFLTQADCNNLRAGDQLKWWDQGVQATYIPHIVSTNCGAIPPRVVLDGAARADGNGTSGIPFTYASGIANNSRYGFLIWSDDDLTSATIRVDQGLWRAASYLGGSASDTLAVGSGGFNKRCQQVKTSGGFTLCAAGHVLWALKPQSDGSLDMRFLGIARVRPDLAGQTNAAGENVYFDNSSGDFFWDDSTAGVFYLPFTQTFTSPASGTPAIGLGRFVLSAPETAIPSDPDSNPTPSPFIDSMASKTLTACLNSCTSASTDDYTIAGQALRIDPGHDFTRWRVPDINSVEDGYIKLTNREGDQDTFGQSFMFDIGNGSTIGAGYAGTATHPTVAGHNLSDQQIFAFNPTYATKGMRWGQDHTQQPIPYSSAFTVEEAGEKNPYQFTITQNIPACVKGSTCDACPTVTLDGISYTSSDLKCIHVTTATSSWMTGVWETQPSGFTAGDPVNTLNAGNPNYHWIQHLAPGDIVSEHGSGMYEWMKLIVYNSATDLWFERGCNSGVGIDGTPKNWGTNSVWNTVSNAYPPDCSIARTETGSGAQMWDFVHDPLAADTHFTTYQNHAFTACNGGSSYRANPDYLVQKIDCTDWTALQSMTPRSTILLPLTFASVSTTGNGDAAEKHPGAINLYSSTAANRTWFLDSNPLEFFADGSAGQHVLVSGKTNTYKLGAGPGSAFHPKLFPIGVFSGQPAYYNISAPGAVLGDTTADRGKMCIAVVASDCISGSSAGDIYVNGPLDPLELYCRAIEFWSGQLDTCAGDAPNFSAGVNQWLLPTDNASTLSANHFRTLSKHAAYRFNATDNVKANPDGDYMFFRNDPWYAKLPPLPGTESLNRRTFLPQTITVSTAPRGTSRLVVEFGYDENFRCSDNRAEACYAVGSTLNESTPFLWGAELNSSSGVPCSSGCAITIPTIPGRVLRYQLVYRNSSGNTVYASPTQIP